MIDASKTCPRCETLRAEGQKLADLLRGVWYLTYPGTLAECGNEVDAALSEWGMVVMGFERVERPISLTLEEAQDEFRAFGTAKLFIPDSGEKAPT